MIQIFKPRNHALDLWWPQVARWVDEALEHGRGGRTAADVLADVREERKQLWIVADAGAPIAVLASEIIEWTDRKALSIPIIGGERLSDWLPRADAMLTAYARSHGCTTLEGCGRYGWRKPLAALGWGKAMTFYLKEI
jgi:hypothetical protein